MIKFVSLDKRVTTEYNDCGYFGKNILYETDVVECLKAYKKYKDKGIGKFVIDYSDYNKELENLGFIKITPTSFGIAYPLGNDFGSEKWNDWLFKFCFGKVDK